MSDVMRIIKANSSKWVHETFPVCRTFAWQNGYGAFTVSESQVDRVRRYIENQGVHHLRMTFEEEFAALLKAHRIEFDPVHAWR